MKRRWVLVILGFVVVGALVGISPNKNRSNDSVQDEPTHDTRTSRTRVKSATKRQSPGSLGLRRGERLVYEFKQEREIVYTGASSPGESDSESREISSKIIQSGLMCLSVYEELVDGWVVGFSMREPSLEMLSGDQSAPTGVIEREMMHELLAKIGTNGRIQLMTASENQSEECRNQWRDILSRWQVTLARRSEELEWKSVEHDPTGSYQAIYSKKSKTDRELSKTKGPYLSFSMPGQEGDLERAKVDSQIVIQLDPYPKKIEGFEKMEISFGGFGGQVVSKSDFKFLIKNVDHISGFRRLAAMKSQRLLNDDVGRFFWSPSDSTTPEIGGQHMEGENGCLAKLRALNELLDAGKNESGDYVKVLGELVELIRKDDTATKAVFDHLSRNALSRKQGLAEGLFGVLGAAGTPYSQRGLALIAGQNEWPMEDRHLALTTLVQAPHPDSEAVTTIRGLHESNGELGQSALLVLGAMGDRLRETEPERFQELSDYVLGRVANLNSDAVETSLALSAVANLGPDKVPSIVHDSLQSPNPFLRESAVRSLERIHDLDAGQLLGNVLYQDPEEGVRVAAVQILADPKYQGGYEALAHVARNDQSEIVRGAAVDSLGNRVEQSPGVRKLLTSIAKQDESGSVREAANAILALASEAGGIR